MAKLTVGGMMPDFTFETPFEKNRTLAETVKRVPGKTAVIFLRYYGCTMCQYDIAQYAAEYEKITAKNAQVLIVLQSDPAKIAAQINRDSLPFDIVCDPAQKLYKEFEIHPAACKEEMLDEAGMAKLAKVRASGLQHGEYEGEELQLPALFIVDGSCTLSHVLYAKTISEIPEPEELAELL